MFCRASVLVPSNQRKRSDLLNLTLNHTVKSRYSFLEFVRLMLHELRQVAGPGYPIHDVVPLRQLTPIFKATEREILDNLSACDYDQG